MTDTEVGALTGEASDVRYYSKGKTADWVVKDYEQTVGFYQ